MRGVVLFIVLTAGTLGFGQAALTADEIMARVAANQDSAEALRRQYVYEQHVHVVSKQTNGKLMREETAEYDVAPTEDGTTKKLKTITGRYYQKGKYVEFHEEQPDNRDGTIDED